MVPPRRFLMAFRIAGRGGEQAKQGEGTQDARAGNLAHTLNGRKARPGVDEHQAPRHDSEQRARGIGPQR